MRIFLFLVLLIVSGVLAYQYVPRVAQSIENKVTENVTATLVPNDLPADVQIKVDGRDVALSGMVVKPSDKENFVKLSQGVTGVRNVKNDLIIAKPAVTEVEIIETTRVIEEDTVTEDSVVEESTTNEGIALDKIAEPVTEEVAEEPVIDLVTDEEFTAPDVNALQEPEITTTQEEVIVMDDSGKKASEECQSTIAALVNGKRVNFTSGQSKIKRESLPLLNDITQEMRGCSDIALHIHGHTDNVGDAKLNRQLSHKRARSVGLYLLRQGVTQRVKIFGNGSDQPIADNETEAGRTANRRIEFNVKDAQASVANDNERTDRSVFTTRSLRDAAIIER